MGQIAHPVGRANPYRVGQDGVPRVLPGTGGITISHRIGDPCVGLAGDHVEPGVALHNNGREIIGGRNGPNLALLTSACVGNRARVASGPAQGATGLVTGKHGGVDHVLVDFDAKTLLRLNIGDRVQIYACGLGLQLLDFPNVTRVQLCAGPAAALGAAPSGRNIGSARDAYAARRDHRIRLREELGLARRFRYPIVRRAHSAPMRARDSALR